MGACQNSIFYGFGLFIAEFLFKSSFFSKSRLCIGPFFSHFVTNLDRLACRLILWIPPWGQSCGRGLYGSTTIQSWSFLKNIKNFLCKWKLVNNCSIPSTCTERKITVCSHKHSFTPHPSLSPYSPTDRIMDRETNTLTAHGLEELFFQLCCCDSFLVSGRKLVLVLLTYVSKVQYSCGIVLVFWYWWEIVFGVTYLLSVQYTCAFVSVFWLWWEIVLWRETVLKKSMKDCLQGSSNCIKNANTSNHTLISRTQIQRKFLLGFLY